MSAAMDYSPRSGATNLDRGLHFYDRLTKRIDRIVDFLLAGSSVPRAEIRSS